MIDDVEGCTREQKPGEGRVRARADSFQYEERVTVHAFKATVRVGDPGETRIALHQLES